MHFIGVLFKRSTNLHVFVIEATIMEFCRDVIIWARNVAGIDCISRRETGLKLDFRINLCTLWLMKFFRDQFLSLLLGIYFCSEIQDYFFRMVLLLVGLEIQIKYILLFLKFHFNFNFVKFINFSKLSYFSFTVVRLTSAECFCSFHTIFLVH